jgi:DNA-binding response OmpR family regulator
MYADSNEDSLDMVTELLRLSNIEVIGARTVTEAWRLFLNERLDAILLATQFPDGSGIELCRRIQSEQQPVPSIFYSGNAYAADIEKGLSAGAKAYVTKPNSDELVRAILSAVDDIKQAFMPQLSAPVNRTKATGPYSTLRSKKPKFATLA